MSLRLPDPVCIGCDVLAADMGNLDLYWPDCDEDYDLPEDVARQERVTYVREDGTYNRDNGHFWCDRCYIRAGMPLGVAP